MVKNLPAMQKIWFSPWVGKIPWRRRWNSPEKQEGALLGTRFSEDSLKGRGKMGVEGNGTYKKGTAAEWPAPKSLQIINAGEGAEEREPSYTAGRKVNWCSHCG